MRVLAHIHTFNDADIIGPTIGSVLKQTRPIDGILVVDNASTDGTLYQPCLKNATVVRNSENIGTRGAVFMGLRYALEQSYDWAWIFDADSTPEPDALEKLLDLYANWPQSQQEETGFLACLPYNVKDGFPYHASVFGRYGLIEIKPEPGEHYYPCHVTLWSGTLFRMAAVRRIGLPNPDYMLDWGESEYAYCVMKAGYKGYMHQDAVLLHNIRCKSSLSTVRASANQLGRRSTSSQQFAAIICAAMPLYLALYDAKEEHFRMGCIGILLLTLEFFVRPWHHGKQISPCFRSIWHGVTGNIAARYS